MNKVNFDSFKQIHASEALIQKALSIPETVEKAPAVLPWYRRTKPIAAAASIVLVTVVGITIYFLFGNKKPPVAPLTKPSHTQTYTEIESTAPDGTSSTVPTTAPASSPDGTAATATASEPASQVGTQSPTMIITIMTTSEPDGSPATRANGERPSEPKTQPATSGAPDRRPTQPATHRPSPTQTPAPTQNPTRQPATQHPTEPRIPDPTYEPIEETEPESPSPTEEERETTKPPTEPDPVLTLRTKIRVKTPFNGVVYCRIYDRDRKIVLGDPDRYDASHMAEWILDGNDLYITYRPSEHGIEVPPGNYAIAFHNQEGKLYMNYYITVS